MCQVLSQTNTSTQVGMTVAQRQSTVKHSKAWGPRTAKREDDFKKKQLELEVTLSG